jgi:hypothetical protein
MTNHIFQAVVRGPDSRGRYTGAVLTVSRNDDWTERQRRLAKQKFRAVGPAQTKRREALDLLRLNNAGEGEAL